MARLCNFQIRKYLGPFLSLHERYEHLQRETPLQFQLDTLIQDSWHMGIFVNEIGAKLIERDKEL